jgi:GTP pyrophosphokinase
VKTPNAKEKIRSWIRRETAEDTIRSGRKLLDHEQKRLGLSQVHLASQANLKREIKQFGFKTLDELYYAIGRGDIAPREIIDRLRGSLVARLRRTKSQSAQDVVQRRIALQGTSGSMGILVDGDPNVFVRLARCCQPIPGDLIVGFTTKGRGVSIHAQDCPQVKAIREKERLLPAEWDEAIEREFATGIDVWGLNRTGILSDITQVLSDHEISVNDVRLSYPGDMSVKIELSVSAHSVGEIGAVIHKIRSIKDVVDAVRSKG